MVGKLNVSWAIYWFGFLVFLILVYTDQLITGFWIAIGSLILSAVFFLFERKRKNYEDRSFTNKRIVLYLISLVLLLIAGWYMY